MAAAVVTFRPSILPFFGEDPCLWTQSVGVLGCCFCTWGLELSTKYGRKKSIYYMSSRFRSKTVIYDSAMMLDFRKFDTVEGFWPCRGKV